MRLLNPRLNLILCEVSKGSGQQVAAAFVLLVQELVTKNSSERERGREIPTLFPGQSYFSGNPYNVKSIKLDSHAELRSTKNNSLVKKGNNE